MTLNITLARALKSIPLKFNIFSLDGGMETITYPVDQIITPKTVFVVPGLGFPIISSSKGSERGDLMIKFNIHFPEKLEEAKKT